MNKNKDNRHQRHRANKANGRLQDNYNSKEIEENITCTGYYERKSKIKKSKGTDFWGKNLME